MEVALLGIIICIISRERDRQFIPKKEADFLSLQKPACPLSHPLKNQFCNKPDRNMTCLSHAGFI